MRDIPIGTVISPMEQCAPFYEKFIPSAFIKNEYYSRDILRLLERQDKICHTRHTEIEKQGKSAIDPRAFLVLDNCFYDAAVWKRDRNLREICMNGRCVKLTNIITITYPLGMGPELRCNIDYVFICRETNVKERQQLYEYYARMFPSFEVFCEILDKYTTDYSCLVIDNTILTDKWEECVFWYRAEARDNFMIGIMEDEKKNSAAREKVNALFDAITVVDAANRDVVTDDLKGAIQGAISALQRVLEKL